MSYIDILLLPLYVLLLYFFFRLRRKKYDDLLRKYHTRGFWIKIVASILFVIYYSYITTGDTTSLYQHEGNNLFHLILKDPSNFKYIFKSGKDFDLSLVDDPYNRGYFRQESNFMIIRLDALFSFICFGSYAVINLLFAALAFSGLWKLYLFFYEQYPKLHKQFAISILYFPSLAFWSSGLLKDTLCIAAVGWLTYSLYSLLVKKKSLIKNSFVIFISIYLLAIVKIYILLAYLPLFILFIVLKKIQRIPLKFFRYLLAPVFLFITIYSFTAFFSTYNDDLGAYSVEELTTSISNLNEVMESRTGREDASSNFSLGETFDGTFSGLIRIAPVAIGTTFFRPFIWEAHKISQLLAAVESLLLMFFTLYVLVRGGIFQFVKNIITDPLIMYCFLFAVVFGLFIGASTLNFGTLVRYKIPCLPFYSIALFLIYEKARERAAEKKLRREEEAKVISFRPSVA
ncbi:MAG: hypothetical protein ACTHK8_07235 [Ginsengibacter sp.]